MKMIAVFQSDLNVGGIQKSIVNLLNNFNYSNVEVHLFLFSKNKFYDSSFGKNIKIFYIKQDIYINRFIYFDVLKIIKMNRKINNTVYDIAIDFNSYWNECALGALSVNAKKKIIWIHNDVRLKIKEDIKYRILWHFFKKKFSYFDEFVFVSEGIVKSFVEISNIRNKPMHVIPNIIDASEIIRKSEEKINYKVNQRTINLVSMGRLCHQKGFDILIDKIKSIILNTSKYRLYILGDGPDKIKLEKKVRKYGLESKIFFLGNQKNPYPYLKEMDAFILASRYEGQGMVLWEAKALGLDIIIPTHLEKYTSGIKGCKSIERAVCKTEKKRKIYNELVEYNDKILKKIEVVFDLKK